MSAAPGRPQAANIPAGIDRCFPAGEAHMKTTQTQTLIGAGTLALARCSPGATADQRRGRLRRRGAELLPWLVAVAAAGCGAFLVWEGRSGGFRELEDPR